LTGPPSTLIQSTPRAESRLLDGLTVEQTATVTHGQGPQIIYAGPGSGKTRTLITRVEHLLATGAAAPSQIVVLTFTNQAAAECSARIRRSLGAAAVRGITTSTFHALCARVLRQHPHRIERRANFTIYDEHDTDTLIERALGDRRRRPVQQQLPRCGGCGSSEARAEISLAKSRLWTPDFYERHGTHPVAPLIATLWRELERELTASNALDFDDLLGFCVRLRGEQPELQLAYRRRWRWLLVDEVQDLTYAQLGLVRLLAEPDGNVTVVGDTDQSLYRWTGAEPRNMLTFAAAFPSRHEVSLGRNFRSRPEIVRAAARLIAHNQNRTQIRFEAARGPGGRVTVRAFENEYAEAASLAHAIARQLRTGTSPNEILVLARTSFALQPPLRALARSNIKHRVLGSLGLFERRVIKDALAYASLLANPDDPVALRRAIAAPRRGVGEAITAAIVAQARERDTDLLSVCADPSDLPRVPARTRAKLGAFGQALLTLRREHEAGLSVADTVAAVLTVDEGGLVAHHKNRASDKKTRRDAERALEDLKLLRASATTYQHHERSSASLIGFLEQAIGLHGEDPGAQDSVVTVSTIHRSKGTEARIVFLCAAEEQIIPTRPALRSGAREDIEQERSAFYVAMTRAKDMLAISWCGERSDRRTKGRSRFIGESGH
jgi:DNA helicase II / ATP-dependent DNA helicase PcrA